MIMGKFTSENTWTRVFALLKFNEMKAQKHKKKPPKKPQQMSPSEMHNTSHYKPTLTACSQTNEPSSLP